MGDSTTRDFFYELLAVAGEPLWADRKLRRTPWSEDAFELPSLPASSRAQDKFGVCNGDEFATPPRVCVRDVHLEPSVTPLAAAAAAAAANSNASRQPRRYGRFSYQYLMSNAACETAGKREG